MSDPLTSPVQRELPSPLVAPIRVQSPESGRARSRFTLDPAEPLLAGHYPGFPIFPGVCLVECAHRTSLGALSGPGRLVEVESARFLGPVLPGDTVHTETVAEAVDGGWRCRARLAAEGPGGAGGAGGARGAGGPGGAGGARGAGGPAGAEGGGGPDGDGRRQVAVVRLRYDAEPRSEPAAGSAPAARSEPGIGAGTRMIDHDGIRRLLPHRPPMLLLDEVREAVPAESVVAAKAVTPVEPCYEGLVPGADDAYPPTLLIESWCQAAVLLVLLDSPNPDVLSGRVALFGGIGGLRFGRPVRPGDVLVHRARLSRQFEDAAVLTGTAEVAGEIVLEVVQIVVAFREAGLLAGAGPGR